MAYSISPGMDAVGLGIVQDEEPIKDAQLFHFPLPRKDSSDAILQDLFGVTKTLRLSGTFSGTKAQIKTFADALLALVNGAQVSQTYTSDTVTNTIKVFIQRVSYKYAEGAVQMVKYEINMIEGATVT